MILMCDRVLKGSLKHSPHGIDVCIPSPSSPSLLPWPSTSEHSLSPPNSLCCLICHPFPRLPQFSPALLQCPLSSTSNLPFSNPFYPGCQPKLNHASYSLCDLWCSIAYRIKFQLSGMASQQLLDLSLPLFPTLISSTLYLTLELLQIQAAWWNPYTPCSFRLPRFCHHSSPGSHSLFKDSVPAASPPESLPHSSLPPPTDFVRYPSSFAILCNTFSRWIHHSDVTNRIFTKRRVAMFYSD